MHNTQWTVDTLKEHFEALRTDDLRALEAVATDVKSKFESMNEFRGALSDAQNKNITRNEAETEFKAIRAQMMTEVKSLNDKFDVLIARLSTEEGIKQGAQSTKAFFMSFPGMMLTVLSIGTVVVAVIAYLLKK
jgi:hypothetical protein